MNNEIFVWLFWFYLTTQSVTIVVLFLRWVWNLIPARKKDRTSELAARLETYRDGIIELMGTQDEHINKVFRDLYNDINELRDEVKNQDVHARLVDLEIYASSKVSGETFYSSRERINKRVQSLPNLS